MLLTRRHVRLQPCFLCAIVLTLGVALSSCVSNGGYTSKYKVYVTNTKRASLLPTQCMDGTMDSLQLFTGSFGGTGFSFQAYIYADSEELELVMLNEFGVDMGTLSYSNDSLSLDSALFPPSLKPEYIVADFQNAFYDPASLSQNYGASRLTFAVRTLDDGTEVRTIKSGTSVIEEITKRGGVTTIVNSLRGYTYILTAADE